MTPASARAQAPAELRRTYAHFTTPGKVRLREVQRQADALVGVDEEVKPEQRSNDAK
jgi:hypothetical protein